MPQKRHKISQKVQKKDQLHLIHKKGWTTWRRWNQTYGKVLSSFRRKAWGCGFSQLHSWESLLDSPCEMNSSLTDNGIGRSFLMEEPKWAKVKKTALGMLKKDQDLWWNWQTGYMFNSGAWGLTGRMDETVFKCWNEEPIFNVSIMSQCTFSKRPYTPKFNNHWSNTFNSHFLKKWEYCIKNSKHDNNEWKINLPDKHGSKISWVLTNFVTTWMH